LIVIVLITNIELFIVKTNYKVNKLNPDSIFSIFEQGDQEVYQEYGMEEELDNPFTLLGTLVTGMENYTILDKLYSFKYQESYSEVKDKIKSKYYNKMYSYLLKIDIDDMGKILGTDTHLDRGRTIEVLHDLLLYYQYKEYYERCAKIKRYIDLLLNKQLEDLL